MYAPTELDDLSSLIGDLEAQINEIQLPESHAATIASLTIGDGDGDGKCSM